MDNLTHTLVGVGLAKAGLSKKYGRGTLLTLVLASNLPDLDVLWAAVVGGDAFLSRRMLTHSVFGIPLLAAALAGLLRLIYKHISWKDLWLLSLLAAGVHAFFDLINSYGVVLLFPLTRRRFELAWVFIIDLAVWAVLMAPFMVLVWRRVRSLRLDPDSRPPSPETPWRSALAFLTAYLVFCGTGRALSVNRLEEKTRRQAPSLTYVFPEALGAHRFRGVTRVDDEFQIYLIHPWTGRIEPGGVFPTDESKPEVQAVRATPRARKLEWFFKAPVWRLRRAEGREWVEVFDLRFHSIVLNWRRNPFVFEFPIKSG